MNKKLLSLAVAAGLASSSALAVVDLNLTTPVPVSLATENTVAATGTAIVDGGTELNIVVDTGFSISDSTARYMRFDFTGATFTGAVASANLVVDDSSGAGNANEVLSTGGAAGGSFVVFEVTASANATVGVTNNATLAIPSFTAVDKSGIAVTYRLFDNAVDAVNNTTTAALVTTSGTVAGFAAATTTAANTAATEAIDVTQGATFFAGGTGDTESVIGSFTTTNTTTPVAPNAITDSTTDVTKLTSELTSTLTITGDFTFAQDLTAGVPDGTYTVGAVELNTDALCTAASTAVPVSLDATTAVFTTTTIGAGVQIWACVNANGVSTIGEGSYSATYVTTGQPGFDAETTNLTLGTLAKNGSTTTLNLALKPGGAFSNFVRVVNTSNITGDVSMTVINDDGDSVNISLGDIEGVSTSALNGQASTDLISIQAIFDAAQAADSTFGLGANSNKLRVTIDGEFSSITAQSITLSTDNTTFTTF